MLKNFPDEEYISDRNVSFIKRVFLLRQVGVLLCFIPIFSVLEEQSHHAMKIVLLIINALTWPSLAYLASKMSKDMLNTEKKNMILDSCWAGIWIALMQVSPIPSIFIVSIQVADRYAAGGWRILKPSLLCMVVSFILIWIVNDFQYTTEFSMKTVWASLPLATCYPILLSVVSRNLSIKLRKRRELLEKQALMDPGLDLPNRRFFENKLEGALRSTRKKRTLSYLLLIDVDNFKCINDTYGHEIGDAVLSRISKILRECAGEKDIPARFGGDELAIIVNNSNDQMVLAIVHTIQERIRCLSLPSHKDIYFTVSIGVSCAKEKTSILNWIKEADEMLYEVKRSGKNGFSLKSNK